MRFWQKRYRHCRLSLTPNGTSPGWETGRGFLLRAGWHSLARSYPNKSRKYAAVRPPQQPLELWQLRYESRKRIINRQSESPEPMANFTLTELNFIRKHYLLDMSALQLARLYNVKAPDIHRVAKLMRITAKGKPLTSLYSPYPFQVARDVDKTPKPCINFSWDLLFGAR